ncbi:hypothetical protein [Halodesulfovibrio aestuarii]|uniref:Transcriptional regulator n=1 Tax=Halodesulfovibrio aestuarii TaxID=126333 RepID=A0ABV4JW79_9BACT
MVKKSFLFDPIKHLREKGVTVRIGYPQNGEDEIALVFEQNYSWTPQRVLDMYRLVQQSRALILMQLNVSRGLPPRSVESLIAKGYIRIACDERGKRRYVITERGKRWMH